MTSRLWISIALLAFFVSGCTTISPKTAALRQVHHAYEEDFAQFALPPAGNTPAPTNTQSGPAFARTLQEIRAYRVNFPTSTAAETAHLQVLEGMIYLQSGRFGLASAIAPKVSEAGAQLASGTGKIVRDRLFAENFNALLKGWTEIGDKLDSENGTIPEWEKLRDAARAIYENLNSHRDGALADADADEGALYLANTAAIFYVWADSLVPSSQPDARTELQTQLARSRVQMSRFLTPIEMDPKATERLGDAPGRLRYIAWYHWLKKYDPQTPATP